MFNISDAFNLMEWSKERASRLKLMEGKPNLKKMRKDSKDLSLNTHLESQAQFHGDWR